MNRRQNERLISEIESLIRRDPARRGLIGADGNGPGKGELLRASSALAASPTGVALITGFFVLQTDQGHPGRFSAVDDHQNGSNRRNSASTAEKCFGNAETDGPPGTAVIADVLTELDIPVLVITDEWCEPVVRSACSDSLLSPTQILASPTGIQEAAEWRAQLLRQPSFQKISHIISIERVGPGHLHVSHKQPLERDEPPQEGNSSSTEDSTGDPWQPGHCCNMRGESIEAFSAQIHLLLESAVSENPARRVIGIGDGGNEIGMGRFSWDDLRARLSGPRADRVPCRTPAEATIVAGVSNWGAYALAAAIAIHRDRVDLLQRHTADSQRQLLDKIVQEAGAVDGVTRQQQATVDGLPFLTQIQPWIAIRERLGMRR